ncbi:MAG: DegT/DnrJ/EryC1/StrS family aminotransferase [Ichthyobacteriaceae bacterium]|nr:DegT/DnrJ/EryC1/StrS family aminotransferase [Ichthyobacteriaceae bacterium]
MIKFLDLKKSNKKYEEQLKLAFNNFIDSGYYILGNGVTNFENEFASYCGTKHCIGVANGLDALTLIFRGYIEMGLLKKGDEVIVPANTYIASVLAISENDLVPVFVEPNAYTYLVEASEIKKHFTEKTKAILVVHLYGGLVEVEEIRKIVSTKTLIVEDSAQAHGSISSEGLKAGNLGNASGFSFYPTKNLGALGDGGAVTTNDLQLANTILKLRNYGGIVRNVNEIKGINSRLHDIQARFLSVKLNDLENLNSRRREIAKQYIKGINNIKVDLPLWDKSNNHVFHQFVIKSEFRNELKDFLFKNGVQTDIHYPTAITKQGAFTEYSDLEFPITFMLHSKILSLPIYPELTDVEVHKVITIVNKF